jgi:tetratricopeptide (TPR) repeat protein
MSMPDTSKAMAKAKEALDRGNLDYAIQLLQEILVVDPDNGDSRKLLRMAEIRNVKQKGISTTSAFFKGATVLMSIKMGKDPEKKMRDCEQFLVNNPTHKGVLFELGKAAMEGGHYGTAIATFEDILQNHGDDVNVLHCLADSHEAKKEIQPAIEIHQRILKKYPNDVYSHRKVKDLAAAKHSEKIADTAIHGRTDDQLKDRKETDVLSKLSQEIRTDSDVDVRINHYQEQAKGRPDDARLQSQIGDLYLRYRQKRFAEAEKCYRRALELAPTDNTYQVKLDELEFIRRRESLAALKKGTPEHTQKSIEVYEFMAQRLEWRAGVYTVDLNVRFALGNTYFNLGQFKKDLEAYRKAVSFFQQTVGDPKNRTQSRLRLGQARARLQEFDLSIEEFTDGINAIEMMNDDKMELIYWRADTYERMGSREDAHKDFTDIYKVRINYRDVKDRLERLKK